MVKTAQRVAADAVGALHPGEGPRLDGLATVPRPIRPRPASEGSAATSQWPPPRRGCGLADGAFDTTPAGDPAITQGEALMDVAVLGLGRMGTELAGRLLDAGHQLRVW